MNIDIKLHKKDIPADIDLSKHKSLSFDCEMAGLNVLRDPLYLVQISTGNNDAHIIQLDRETFDAPNLKKILNDKNIVKIFHYARFDVAALKCNLQINTKNIFCTKIASKLARTYTNKHGLKDLINELLGIELDKSSQSSDWGSNEDLTKDQLDYAANDVRYLIEAMHKLKVILERENRYELAQKCFETVSVHPDLDILKFSNIFEH